MARPVDMSSAMRRGRAAQLTARGKLLSRPPILVDELARAAQWQAGGDALGLPLASELGVVNDVGLVDDVCGVVQDELVAQQRALVLSEHLRQRKQAQRAWNMSLSAEQNA